MTRWQYLVKQFATLEQAELNQLGADGWELVAVLSATLAIFIFKRPARGA